MLGGLDPVGAAEFRRRHATGATNGNGDFGSETAPIHSLTTRLAFGDARTVAMLNPL